MARRRGSVPAARGLPPSQRPQKVCPVCGRPFSWRKQWARCWEEVIYCSERCRRRRAGRS
ncbi:MAG: DUF2256 domain-containing protein [Prochlorococcaceae cyanobacterium]